MRHLLTNASGIPSGFSGDAYEVNDTSTAALERLVREDMVPRRLDFAPGTGYVYSNRGFSAASLVVQEVSGRSYEDYIAERILTPLGMTHSTGRFWEGPSRNMAQGYREAVDGKMVASPASLSREWTGSGMILSTSRDAGRFLQAILNGGTAANGTQVLSAAGVAEMTRPQYKAESELGGPVMYGLGWEVRDDAGMTMVMKAGSVSTMGSLFVMLPKEKTAIALVFNAIDYGKIGLMQNLVKALMGAPTSPYVPLPTAAPVPPSTFKMAAAKLSSFAGVYDTRTGIMRLTVRGDTLAARAEGNDFVLEPTSDTSFVQRSRMRDQEGTPVVIRRCGATMCMWISGDSSAVKR